MQQELITKAQEILEKNNGYADVYFTYESGEKVKKRLFFNKYDNKPAVFRKGSRRYGYRLEAEDYVRDIQEINKRESNPAKKWYSDISKMRTMLEESGLWTDLLEDVKLAMDVGYEKIQKCYDIYWFRREGLDYRENDKLNLEEIRKVEPRFIEVSKDTGNEFIETKVIWYLRSIKIKKMNFGEEQLNQVKLMEIARALHSKQNISISGRTNYDVSFEYNAEKGMAWYSEEYKNCGNGHYYLALNGTHAIFWEDD